MMYQTPFRQTSEGSYLRAEFGLHVIGTQAPYMSVTGEEHTRPKRLTNNTWLSGGCLHEQIASVFPELRGLIRWHLATDGAPMHYIANAEYWHAIANCLRRASSADEFKRAPSAFAETCKLGALPNDLDAGVLLILPWNNVKYKLADRMPAMREAYRAAVATIPAIVSTLDAIEVAS